MKNYHGSMVVGLILCCLLGEASAQVQVVSKTPYGPIADMNAARVIAATFSRPMAPLSSAEKMGEECPLEVFAVKDKLTGGNYPSFSSVSLADFKKVKQVKGRCRWQGTQTVTFEPAKPLRPASLYAARVRKGFTFKGMSIQQDAEWFFETLRPSIKQSAPRNDQRWLPLDTVFYAAFNLPMDSRRARRSVELFERAPDGRTKKRLVGVRLANDDEVKKLWPYPWQKISTGAVVAVRPARPLKPDHAYTLRFLSGMLAAEGNLGLVETRELVSESYYTFSVKKKPVTNCLPNIFRLGFSNPVKLSDLYEHMTVTPSTGMPELRGRSRDYEGSRHHHERTVYHSLPRSLFSPETPYLFRISPELPDIFGNKLGEDVSFSLGPMNYCPYWNMPTGFGILESYLPARHPVNVVNAGVLNVLKGRIRDDDIVPFMSGRMNNEDYLSAREEKRWDPSQDDLNVKIRTFLDYRKNGLFGAGEGGFGFLRMPATWGGTLRAVDNITSIGLTVKSSQDSTFIWTTFLKTGRPAAGVSVEIRSEDNEVLWSGNSDHEGFVDAPGWLKLGITDWPRRKRPALWVFARRRDGTAVMNTGWNGGVEPWRFRLNYDKYPRPRKYAAAVFTERGVYRPGEVVDIKAVGRKLSGGDWVALDIPVAQVSLWDSRGTRVYTTTVAVNQEFSSFDLAYKLPDSGPTGRWTVEVSEPFEEDNSTARAVRKNEEGRYRQYIGREQPFLFREKFSVEEFKPAVFEVKTRSLEPYYTAGDTFRAAVEGWYLFGAPMAGSRADWTLRLNGAYYAPPGREGFRFSGGFGRGRVNQLAGSGSLELDPNGKGEVEAQLPKSFGSGNALRASLEAGVTDPERQRLFGRTSAYVHRANLYLGIKASGGFVEAGKPWSAEIIAVRPDGSSIAGIPIGGRMVKRQWLSTRRAGLGGRLEWVSEKKDTEISSFTFVSSVSTEAWGFTPDEGGYYILTLSGSDEKGRKTETSFSFYVFGDGDAWWARRDSDIVELVPEKHDYKPGETARIMVKSPYKEAQALVTVEREGVLDRWLTTTKGGADFIEVPIKEKHLPNAYVSVILLKGRADEQKFTADGSDDLSKPQAKFGYVQLGVSPAGRRLSVELKSDKADYRPGQEVTLDISAVDEDGLPVAAELTVFAVDEGVLSLTGYATPDIFSAFYGARPLNVLTADSRLHVIGQRSYGEKGESRGGGGGVALAGIDLRSDFRPTAYWNPSVRTDSDGKASVSFKLPDSLTRFRLMAVANSGLRFGSGDTSVTVSKPLVLRPSLPRLARAGDSFDCGVVVHNYTCSVSSVDISIAVNGDAVLVRGKDFRRVEIGSGKAEEILWACTADRPGETVFRFRAKAGSETDGLEWRLPVKTWEPREHSATSGVTSGMIEEALLRPYTGAQGDVFVGLSASALSGLNEGARYLLEYPYGCLEQKLSRSMPVITGAELIETFGLGSLGTLREEVQKVMEKLPAYQHPSGGFCYWPGGCIWPDPYLTAYTLEASALAVKEGYTLDPAVIKRAMDWLERYLSSERTHWAYPYSISEDYAARAYAVYSLAMNGRNMSPYFNRLYLKRAQLPYLAKGYMVKAARLLDFDVLAAKKLTAEIMTQARYSQTQLHFEDSEPMPWIHNTAVKTTAVMLDALLMADGGFSGDEKAVKWLTTEKKNKGRWRNTQENAWALRAFQNYYRRYEKEEPNFKAVVSNMKENALYTLVEDSFLGRSLETKEHFVDFPTLFGERENAKLLFSKSGAGRLYYTLRMGFVPQKRDKPASEGLEISREIRPMDGGGVFKAGKRAIVTITVRTPQDRTFVVVNDPLPAGFEIVNTEFAVESAEDAKTLAKKASGGNGWGGFHRAERYDDRMLIFADYLTEGEHKYSYIVQATVPGTFYGPAALAEGMYEPEVFGRTAGGSVEIVR